MNKKKKKIGYLIGVSILIVIGLYFFDQILALNYMCKAGLKIVLFAIFPMGYMMKTRDFSIVSAMVKKEKSKDQSKFFKISVIIGVVVFFIIIVAYVFLQPLIDVDTLVFEFQDKYKIDQSNVVFYSVYLVLLNSFLEEFFFRGFLFLHLKRLGLRKTAYVFSALLFAVYHIANFQNWFHFGLFLLALLGLFVGGCLFSYLDEESETLTNGWIVHLCADAAIVLVGFHLFGIFDFSV